MALTKTKKEQGETSKFVQQQRKGKRKRDESSDEDVGVEKKASEKCNTNAT